MQELPQTTTPNASEEVLIERKITFRNSTFGGLKAFIRDHQRRTGQHLSNAAAVDMALRIYLARHIHPGAVAEMQRLSRPDAIRRLRASPQEVADEAPTVTLRVPRINIAVDMPGPRPWLVNRTSGDAA